MQVEDDQVALITELYAGLYTTQDAPHQGDPPKRRRRRKSKGEGSAAALKKRKLSEEQQNMLEISFGCEHKLESERKDRLAAELGLDPRQVAVWFQNRRARWKNKKLEEEYSKLRNQHENLLVEKCRLETEVLSLKDKLTDAKEEINKLREKQTPNAYYGDNVSSNSPTSSTTIDHNQANVMDPQLIDDQLGMGGCSFDAIFYVPNDDYASSMDWVNFYNM